MSARATWKVSMAVMASRVLGLVREAMFAGIFGGTRWLDCFLLAYKIPNLLRDLFAEGALSQAFVTTFSKKLKSEGEDSAWRLANKMVTLAAVFMGLVTLAGVAAAPWIVDLLTTLSRSGAAPRVYDPQETALIIAMARIMYPFLLLVSLAALAMGMLNARGIFGMPALASCFFNLGAILGGAGFGWWLDPEWGPRSLLGFAIGVVIGGLAQLACQFPALWRAGYRFALDFGWRDSGVRHILRLMLPACIAASVVQVNVVVNAMFAYGVGEGAVSWLAFAFRLMQLPIGVFGVAVATVTLPAMARAAVGGISPDFLPVLAKGMRLVAFLVLPCALGLIVLAEPVVAAIYQWGRFSAHDRQQTALALQAYSCGLLFYSWLKVLQPAFYAIEKRWLPMMVSFLSLFLNAGFNYVFVFVLHWGHASLALTTSLSAGLGCVLLYLAMRRYAGGMESRKMLGLLARMLPAAALMVLFCVWVKEPLLSDGVLTVWWLRSALLGLSVALAAGVYFGVCALFRVPEARESLGLLRRGRARDISPAKPSADP